MLFHIRKRRQPPAVIIVALIDVLIVVLIFLMVTTTFKKPSQSLRLVLPESSQAVKSGANEAPPLVIYVEATGNLRLGPNAIPMTIDSLKTELVAEAAKNPDLKVSISADSKAPWGQVVRVMDAAKELKLKSVNVSVKPATQP